jgi:hypothetical protein
MAIFYINIPLGIIATLLTLSFVEVQNTEKLKSNQVDWIGIILLASFMVHYNSYWNMDNKMTGLTIT